MSSHARLTLLVGWILASLAGVAAPLAAQEYYPAAHPMEDAVTGGSRNGLSPARRSRPIHQGIRE